MTRGLLVVDLQVDFCEGGALAVEGGNAVAAGIGGLVESKTGLYPVVFASKDWHNPLPDLNGGHFAPEGEDPDYVSTWPVHCVAGTPGADLHPEIERLLAGRLGRSVEVVKGMGRPDYSAFQGYAPLFGRSLAEVITMRGVTRLDVVGIATDHCVYQSVLGALDQLPALVEVRVLTDYVAGVDEKASAKALDDLAAMGAKIIERP